MRLDMLRSAQRAFNSQAAPLERHKPAVATATSPRVRAYGKARLDMAQHIKSSEDWEKIWRNPAHPFALSLGSQWKQCIDYHVEDFPAEIGFLVDVLGLQVKLITPEYAMFTSPGEEFFFGVSPAVVGSATPPDAMRMQFLIKNLDQVFAELERRDVIFETKPAESKMLTQRQATFRTPNRMLIELLEEFQIDGDRAQTTPQEPVPIIPPPVELPPVTTLTIAPPATNIREKEALIVDLPQSEPEPPRDMDIQAATQTTPSTTVLYDFKTLVSADPVVKTNVMPKNAPKTSAVNEILDNLLTLRYQKPLEIQIKETPAATAEPVSTGQILTRGHTQPDPKPPSLAHSASRNSPALLEPEKQKKDSPPRPAAELSLQSPAANFKAGHQVKINPAPKPISATENSDEDVPVEDTHDEEPRYVAFDE